MGTPRLVQAGASVPLALVVGGEEGPHEVGGGDVAAGRVGGRKVADAAGQNMAA